MMNVIDINIQNQNNISYSVFIGNNLASQIIDYFSGMKAKKAVVVTNETIFKLYSGILNKIFNSVRLKTEYCILPDGEQFKNQIYLDKIITCAFENKLERQDVFVAFGGGVIGDMTGFAASVYLRGINFIQIPTTLLAQVDSSVGGKTGINNSYGKNLIGAFYQPNIVFADIDFLKTLPFREHLTGLAEIVKYSFIEKNCNSDFTNFAEYLYNNADKILHKNNEVLANIISKSCSLKADVVRKDEKEKGRRAILNFGHTVAHSLEKSTLYSVFTHGEAVAVGMKAALLISKKLNKINEDYFEFANKLLDKYKLNYKIPKNVLTTTISDNLIYDKKVIDNKVRFVLPVDYAEVLIFDNVQKELVEEVLKELY